MRFFNLDLHVSVIADLKYVFDILGHAVDSWSISGHSWVFGATPRKVKIVNQHTWRHIDQKMCDEFYKHYRDVLKGYDAFIVTHTPCFAMLYEMFNKPIITVSSTRYEFPFSKSEVLWSRFNEFLRNMIDRRMVIPIANNEYDAAYAEYFTHRKWKVIPSLCSYTNSTYKATLKTFIIYSKFSGVPHFDTTIHRDALPKSMLSGRGFEWSDLVAHRGIIHMPYNVSTMSICEHYTSNIPLFFPSLSFIEKLYIHYANRGVLSELSYNRLMGLPAHSVVLENAGVHNDPNRFDSVDIMMEWIKLADYYNEEVMPFIIYFDSFEHLSQLLQEADVAIVSDNMRAFNVSKRDAILLEWKTVLDQIK